MGIDMKAFMKPELKDRGTMEFPGIERYKDAKGNAYEIYDDQYGSDVMNKIGNADLSPDYLESDIPEMISDAFQNMEEILEIDDLQFEILDADSIYASFTAATIFGSTMIEGDISDG